MTLSAGFQYGNKDLLTKTKNYFWFDDFNQALKEGGTLFRPNMFVATSILELLNL